MMKYNYIKFMSMGLIVAVLGLFTMQLSAQSVLNVEESAASGQYNLYPTQYGDFIDRGDTISGELAIVTDGEGNLSMACSAISDDLTGKIAVVSLDTFCVSADKVTNVMDAGASAVILVSNTTTEPALKDPNNISDIPAFIMRASDFNVVAPNAGDINTVDLFYAYDESDNVIWGDDPTEGEFAGGLNGWTTQVIFNEENDSTWVWKWDENSTSEGFYRDFIFDSPSNSNGVALMDNATYLSDGGTTEPDFNSSTGYTRVASELISPVIDLSGSGAISVKWYQFVIGLNMIGPNETFVGLYFSTDGGDSWSSRIDVPTSGDRSDYLNPEVKSIFIPESAGEDDFRFKIEFDSDLYAMFVDNVTLVEPPSSDLAIESQPFYTPKNFTQPEYSIDYDTFFFSTEVVNRGAEAQENMELRVEIIDLATDEVIESITGETDTIVPVSGSATVEIDETYVPSELEDGDYSVRYTILPDGGNDSNPSDNTGSYNFRVSDNKFSMVPSFGSATFLSISDGQEYGHANLYEIPAEVQETYIIDNIESEYANPDGIDVEGLTTQFLVSAIPDTVADDFSNFSLPGEAPLNLSTTERIAYQDIVLDGNSQEGDLITAEGDEFLDATDFITPLDEVVIENGKRYFIYFIIPDSELELPISDEQPIDRIFAPLIWTKSDGQYFTGYQGDVQALVDLNLKLKTTVDASPLPEKSLKVFPNPVATSQIQAELTFDKPTTATITIAGMDGSVQSFNTYKNVTNQTVREDVSNLPAGTYLMRLATKEGSRTVKFIKQ